LQEPHPKPVIHLLIDLDENVNQIPFLTKFMERIGAAVPAAVNEKYLVRALYDFNLKLC
jgi:hypothetical protein